MSEQDRYGIRPGEVAVKGPVVSDASLQFIGRIRTPFQTRADCPRQGDMEAGPVCTLEIAEKWRLALVGLEKFGFGDVLYWLDQSRRDLVHQRPGHSNAPVGTFAIRSPVRPNPIGLSRVAIVELREDAVLVRGLDCLDKTPLLDIKPNRCVHAPS
ncbi:MAG: tRNA (N6-threonylcarbamoyladenosine(37)-N6)-methyltransferase TrmO [Marinibacterium sp.]|nr:tRNA (N6-threonylcarbamoyladenosine(37)-N6)-methyltransferase TrmO [Marinibacterium sp.]